jgi:hypothetical protein
MSKETMELTVIILGILVAFGYYYFKENRKKKDKLQDWKPHED